MNSNKETRFVHDFFGVINELEIALCIDGEDYATRDIETAISNIKQRLQKQYGLDMSGSIDDVYTESIIGGEVKTFLDNIQYMYNKVAGCGQYFRYIGNIPINLSKLNYMGFTKDSLLAILRMLQVEGHYDSLIVSMQQIREKLCTLPMSYEKKLFMILSVSYILKLYELTDAIAELLYIGGL